MPQVSNHRRWIFPLALLAILLSNRLSPAQEAQFDLSGAQWRVRDVATKSPLLTADQHGDVGPLKLRLQLGEKAGADQPTWTQSCTVIDTTGGERAVTLALCIPIHAPGLTWHDDPQVSRKIVESPEPY